MRTKMDKIEDALVTIAVILFIILFAMMLICAIGSKPVRDPVHQQIYEESMIT